MFSNDWLMFTHNPAFLHIFHTIPFEFLEYTFFPFYLQIFFTLFDYLVARKTNDPD